MNVLGNLSTPTSTVCESSHAGFEFQGRGGMADVEAAGRIALVQSEPVATELSPTRINLGTGRPVPLDESRGATASRVNLGTGKLETIATSEPVTTQPSPNRVNLGTGKPVLSPEVKTSRTHLGKID